MDVRQNRPGLAVLRRGGDEALDDGRGLRKAPQMGQAIAFDAHRLMVARVAVERLPGEGERLADLVLGEEDDREIGQHRRTTGHQRERRAQARLGAGMVVGVGVVEGLEEQALGASGGLGCLGRNGGIRHSRQPGPGLNLACVLRQGAAGCGAKTQVGRPADGARPFAGRHRMLRLDSLRQ